jgi:hypothetical protein
VLPTASSNKKRLVRGHDVAVRRRRDHVAGSSLVEHVGDALGREVDRHRDIRGAGLEDAELRHHGGHRAVEQQADVVARTNARVLQGMREVAGLAVEFAVGHGGLAMGKGDGVT